jgi:hypothetical protein
MALPPFSDEINNFEKQPSNLRTMAHTSREVL